MHTNYLCNLTLLSIIPIIAKRLSARHLIAEYWVSLGMYIIIMFVLKSVTLWMQSTHLVACDVT